MPKTIREIVARNKWAAGHFFDSDTMKSHGQSVEDFTVLELHGRTFIYAKNKNQYSLSEMTLGEVFPSGGIRLPVEGRSNEELQSCYTKDHVHTWLIKNIKEATE